MSEISVGRSLTIEKAVTSDMLAINVGSGDVNVFATPMMLAMMEEAAALCIAPCLDEGMTSVGTAISSSHIAATPLSMKVGATATVIAVEGKKISFNISAFDAACDIGSGTHERVIVNRDKFNARAADKLV